MVDGTGSVGGVDGGVDPSTSSTSMLRRRNSSSSSSRRPPPSQFDTPANDSNHHRRDESIAEVCGSIVMMTMLMFEMNIIYRYLTSLFESHIVAFK